MDRKGGGGARAREALAASGAIAASSPLEDRRIEHRKWCGSPRTWWGIWGKGGQHQGQGLPRGARLCRGGTHRPPPLCCSRWRCGGWCPRVPGCVHRQEWGRGGGGGATLQWWGCCWWGWNRAPSETGGGWQGRSSPRCEARESWGGGAGSGGGGSGMRAL